MVWVFNNPLYSLSDEEQNVSAREVWEGESLGGIMEDNNRLPQPVVWLLGLTIMTAFMITFPLWGQRPNGAMYEEYVALMDTPEVQALSDDKAKMKFIVDKVKSQGSVWAALQERHPLEMDDLRMIKGQIIELKNAGKNLAEFSVVGDKMVMANFEGNMLPDGSRRERLQPWWDKGYTIDVFYVTYFCIAVMIAVKRLPNHEWQPDHDKAH
ncbi:MAG: hypothetical protein GC138_05820 [Gammaproteobacteria bacterium]|nr:hypothetical protein [Gammaproteobacteria bacterium]